MLFIGGEGIGKKTATAGTRIKALIGGNVKSFFTHLLNIRITTGATAHTLTVMRAPPGTGFRSRVTSDLAAAGTALVVDDDLTDADGNALAANDYVAVKLDNGTWHLSLASGWDGPTNTITLATAIPTGRSAKRGAQVVSFGAHGDTYHATQQFASASGATNNIPALAGQDFSLIRAACEGEPLLLDIDNGTNASTIDYANCGYAKA